MTQGKRGAKGTRGPKGSKGPRGLKGSKGSTGRKGRMGRHGLYGPKRANRAPENEQMRRLMEYFDDIHLQLNVLLKANTQMKEQMGRHDAKLRKLSEKK